MKLSEATLLEIANDLERRAYRSCRKCGGTGIRATERVVCGQCAGNGKTKTGKPCRFCNGVGHREIEQVCPRCNGSTQESIYGLLRAAQDIRYVAGNEIDPSPYGLPPLDSELETKSPPPA